MRIAYRIISVFLFFSFSAIVAVWNPASARAGDFDVLEPAETTQPDFNPAQMAGDQSINEIIQGLDRILREVEAAKARIMACGRIKGDLRNQAAAKADQKALQQIWASLLGEYAAYRNAHKAAFDQIQQVSRQTEILDQTLRRMGE